MEYKIGPILDFSCTNGRELKLGGKLTYTTMTEHVNCVHYILQKRTNFVLPYDLCRLTFRLSPIVVYISMFRWRKHTQFINTGPCFIYTMPLQEIFAVTSTLIRYKRCLNTLTVNVCVSLYQGIGSSFTNTPTYV